MRAARLRMGGPLRPVTEYARSGNFYGTVELVSMLERTAGAVASRWPGSQLSVGELSGPRGGKLKGHRSHQSGRDVDLAFFMYDSAGRSPLAHAFVAFNRHGLALPIGRGRRYFDDARNWAMVSSLLRAPEADVQYMFVAKRLRARLLREGRRQGASEELLEKAARVMVQPRGHKHANHFHVRIYCAQDDRPQCKDKAPYWPWYKRRRDGGPEELRRDLPTADLTPHASATSATAPSI